MTRGLYTAATGMLAEQTAQDALAQNLANASTTGYKEDIPQFGSFADTLMKRVGDSGGAVGSVGCGAQIQALATDFSDGALQKTGNSLDLALTGDASLAIQTTAGPRLSRDGALTRSAQGLLVQASGGGLVLGVNGQPIRIPGQAKNIVISPQGRITVDGKAAGQLRLVGLSRTSGAAKAGDNQFTQSGARPVSAGAGVQQGFLESSNVSVVKEMVAMISCMRAYETNQKMAKAQDEMTGKAVNDVGKV